MGVATFQPARPMALMILEDVTDIVVCVKPPETEPRYVRTWPDVRADKHVPAICPGSPFVRSYPLESC